MHSVRLSVHRTESTHHFANAGEQHLLGVAFHLEAETAADIGGDDVAPIGCQPLTVATVPERCGVPGLATTRWRLRLPIHRAAAEPPRGGSGQTRWLRKRPLAHHHVAVRRKRIVGVALHHRECHAQSVNTTLVPVRRRTTRVSGAGDASRSIAGGSGSYVDEHHLGGVGGLREAVSATITATGSPTNRTSSLANRYASPWVERRGHGPMQTGFIRLGRRPRDDTRYAWSRRSLDVDRLVIVAEATADRA